MFNRQVRMFRSMAGEGNGSAVIRGKLRSWRKGSPGGNFTAVNRNAPDTQDPVSFSFVRSGQRQVIAMVYQGRNKGFALCP